MILEEEDGDGEANIEITETVKEPDVHEVDKSQKAISFKVFATADYTRYECSTREV